MPMPSHSLVPSTSIPPDTSPTTVKLLPLVHLLRPACRREIKDRLECSLLRFALLARRETATTRCWMKLEKTSKKKGKYKSANARKLMTEECTKHTGKTPYDWQLDVADALLLGLDSVLIASTGAGKTLPFALPLLVDNTGLSKIIIVLTLNELERDQAERFNNMGIAAAAVNGETYDDALHKKLLNHKICVVITSPEMLFKHDRFLKLIRSPGWMKRILCTIIDEVHCITHWGANFCKDFDKLGAMRSFMSISKPFLIASATLTPSLLDETLDKLEFNCQKMFKINLGSDRPNITPMVCKLLGGTKDFEFLEFLLQEAFEGDELIWTIVYVNACELAMYACLHLQNKLPPEHQDRLDFLHSLRHPLAKKRTMRLFHEGSIKILIAMEVAGMGMDISDI
ncbi:P-loop containing nucleoside triphosphate hydrolase protein [Cytidiella melzeri]|nr:P-loop containing nucleoside triphosphate hydrolase protein [Cytidiella melzeri]